MLLNSPPHAAESADRGKTGGFSQGSGSGKCIRTSILPAAQPLNVSVAHVLKSHFGEIDAVSVGGRPVVSYFPDPLGFQLLKQIGSHREIAVLRRRVVELDVQDAVIFLTQQDGDRFLLTVDEPGAIRAVQIHFQPREAFVDVNSVGLNEMHEIAVFRGHRDDLVGFGGMHHFPQKMDIDRHKTRVHDRRRIRMDDQRVNGKNDAAHRIDDPELEDGRHEE